MSYDNFMICLMTCLTTMFVNWAPEHQVDQKSANRRSNLIWLTMEKTNL